MFIFKATTYFNDYDPEGDGLQPVDTSVVIAEDETEVRNLLWDFTDDDVVRDMWADAEVLRIGVADPGAEPSVLAIQ